MSVRVVWSPSARADLEAIWSYYATAADIDTADRIVDRLYERVAGLDRFSDRGSRVPKIRPNVRMLVSSPHVIYYETHSDAVRVLRVLHGRQDRERALREERE